MPKITFLPNKDICPDGAVIEAPKGTSICRAALDNGIPLEHACELSCACTTCHVYVVKGLGSLDGATEDEDDYLDKAWSLQPNSRLSCQALLSDDDITVEIPRYTINHASERH
jgi:ferredoxin, 2Fe-2S